MSRFSRRLAHHLAKFVAAVALGVSVAAMLITLSAALFRGHGLGGFDEWVGVLLGFPLHPPYI